MIGRKRYQNRIELLQGTLDMLILQTLQWGANHGYGIVQALRVNSGEVLQVESYLRALDLDPTCYGIPHEYWHGVDEAGTLRREPAASSETDRNRADCRASLGQPCYRISSM